MPNAAYQQAVKEALQAQEGKGLETNQDFMDEKYFAGLPEGQTKESVLELAKYDAEWGDSFHRQGAESLASYVKDNEEIDNASISWTSPFKKYAVDYARPTVDNPTTEDRVNSFSLRTSVDAEDGLLSDVRSRIGNLYANE